MKPLWYLAISFVVLSAVSEQSMAQQTDSPEKIRQTITAAGESYRSGKVDEACKGLEDAAVRVQKLAKSAPDAKSEKALQVLHAGLVKAYQKLETDGIDLAELPSWEKILQAKKESAKATAAEKSPSASGKVSFFDDVAPWMVTKCGRCHVDKSSGGFSMATMSALLKGSSGGSVIIDKDAAHSRLVEVIESGDMPRGGAKVTAAELTKLKDWINESYPLDQKQIDTPIKSLVRAIPFSGGPPSMKEEVRKPTGKETVSFSKDIAPVLITACAGCHYEPQQLRGGLNINTFDSLVKGGESGSMIQVGKGEASLLVKALRGTAGIQRMPAGRPALKDDQITMISKWIDEGAAYDGGASDVRLEQVATRAWVESATPEEMTARRLERAEEKWRRAFSQVQPDRASDSNFIVIGGIGQGGVDQVLKDTQVAMEKIRKALRIKADDPMAKGGITIFAIKNRYDYGEWGKMNESRILPSQWSGHWRRAVVDVYVVIHYDSKDSAANQANLVQQLSALWISGNKGTPSWFSDGFGRASLAMIGGRSEPKVKEWDQRLPVVLSSIETSKDLLDGKLNEEDAAILGYALVRKMIDSSSRKPFDSFLRAIDSTKDFNKAFSQAVGPLESTLAAAFGIKTGGKAKRGS
jgi:mono/diheme cytochrome c family protein